MTNTKSKKYDWQDSNLSLFGSDVEKQFNMDSADQETVWHGAGEYPGVQVWRIVQSTVNDWYREDYGQFFDSNSYIILNTHKEANNERRCHDIHFWIGDHSTKDDYRTAAYKTVELSIHLANNPVLHREVQGHESALFKSYFSKITLLNTKTGHRRVLPQQYKPRLLKLGVMFDPKTRLHKAEMVEVPLNRSSIVSENVYIFDLALALFQFNGNSCNPQHKYMANTFMSKIRSERGGKPISEVLEEDEVPADHQIYRLLSDEAAGSDDPEGTPSTATGERKMFRVSDAKGSLRMEKIACGADISKDKLSSDDVFIINTGDHCYCWLGRLASLDMRRNVLSYASSYLNNTETPWLPISVVDEGYESSEFKAAF